MTYRNKITFNDHPQLDFGWDDAQESSERSSRSSYVRHTPAARNRHAEEAPKNERLNFISLGSGSSGNCCYLGTDTSGILIDAGVRADIVEDSLLHNGLNIDNVRGILLTHDHSDHIKYAYTLLRTHKHIRLFCTNRVLMGVLRRHSISKRIKEYHTPIFKEIPFKVLDFEVTAFEVPHDGTDNMGFSIEYGDRRFVIATDLGAVTERAHYYMSRANYLVIEANYDLKMLRLGRYPEYLKARIQTTRGHLDNTDTAAFLTEIMNPELEYIFLCHLSADNNTPEKALETVGSALREAGYKVGAATGSLADRACDVQLMALPRYEPSQRFVFRKPS